MFLFRQPSTWHNRSCSGMPLLALLLLLAALLSAASSNGDVMRFQSLLHSGNHQGAYRAAEELTRLKPKDGYSWYVAYERLGHKFDQAPPSNALFRYLLAIALELQGGQSNERLFQALNEAVKCHQHPPPPPAYLRLKQLYDARGLLEEGGYILLSGADSHPHNGDIWFEICFLLLRMLSKSCLRTCQTAMRLVDATAMQDAAAGGLASSGAAGLPQEAIGIFALSDHQPHVGLTWLLRSLNAQSKPLPNGAPAAKPRIRTIFWALVARARLLAWNISVPHSEGFFSELKSFPAKEITDSIVAFHFLEAGGPSDMILWLMSLQASRFALVP